jgi:ABC-type lipoprotein release transport system permease subunit
MRLITYAGLVLRRLWAKRAILVGSFLGATLVASLLVIVPLYESSIAAVDLLFTFRQAPAAQVDVRVAANQVPYDPTSAQDNRALLERARQRIGQWYPSAVERTQSRELAFIPLVASVDWVAAGESWRDAATTWVDAAAALAGITADPIEVLVPWLAGTSLPAELSTPEIAEALGDIPNPPYPSPAPEATVSRLFTTPGIEGHLELTAGSFGDPTADDLQIVLGSNLARILGLGPGDRTILKPFVSAPSAFEIVEVTGIATPSDPTAVLWQGTLPEELVFVTPEAFDRWLVKTPSDPLADPWLRDARGLGPMNGTQVWAMEIDRESVLLEEVDILDANITSFTSELGRNGLITTAAVPTLIEEFDVRSVVFGAPILAMLALVVAGALYFLIYTAALTVEREGSELALLRTRGASAWQTVGIHLAQSLVIVIAAAVLAPFVARAMVTLTGLVPPMSDLTGGEPLRVAEDRSIVPFVLGGAALAFASMGLAILPFARRSVLELRMLAARPTRRSVWQKYYIDVFGIVLAGVLLFELRQRGLVETTADPGLDPFAIASPALFLFAGALVLLRLLPVILRGLGWLLTRTRGMATALPGWHLGRNPVPYGRLALLIWLTTGFGAFALTYAQTLSHSYSDRASFAAGTDARLIAPDIGFLPTPDLEAAAVYRTKGAARGSIRSTASEVLAVRPEEFAAVVAWRDDFGDPPAQTFGLLRPDGPPDLGVELPPEATAITFDAVTVPPSWAEQVALSQVTDAPEPTHLAMVVRAVDERGRLWTFASEPIADAAWSTYEITLDLQGSVHDTPGAEVAKPLTIQSVWLESRSSTSSPQPTNGEEVLVDGLAVIGDGVDLPLWPLLDAELEARAGLSITDQSASRAADTYYSVIPDGVEAPTATERNASPLSRQGRVQMWQPPTTARVSPVPHLTKPPATLRILLDSAGARLGSIGVGALTSVGIESQQISGEFVGRLGVVPTADDPTAEGVMITDLDVLLHWLNLTPSWALGGDRSPVAAPQELWIKSGDPQAAIAGLLAATEQEVEVVTAAGVEAAFSSRPVQIGLVSILFVGAATGVILALAGVTSYVLIAVRRRTKEMGVLRALGFPRSGVAGTFAVEQIVVLGLGAFIGVIGGIGLMRLLIPFVQLGEAAEVLTPEVLLVLDFRVLGTYLAVVAGLLVTSVLWATRSVSARELAEVLREVDR